LPGRTNVVLVALAALAVGVFAFAGSAKLSLAQEAPATLSFAPPPATLPSGQQATYVLGIAGAQRLFGADIEVSFDPAVASVVDADPAREGVQVTILPFLDPGFVVFNVADNAAGKVRVTYTQVAPKAAANGNGSLISIDLKATGGGDPKLRVSAALLAREDGLPQPVTLPSTGVTPVAPSASPAPNPTEIPTPARPSTALAGGTVASTQAVATLTPAIIPSGPGAEPDDDASTNWTLALVLGGVAVAALAAVVVGRRYLKRNGETE
jgi:hypothetical protein